MTSPLLDRPFATGSTLYQPARRSPAVRDAHDFYERGAPSVERTIKIQSADPNSVWLASLMQDRLNDLLHLPAGWDGRRAREVTLHAALGAANAAFAVGAEASLAPQVFPLSNGGVQLEWHAQGQGLEIEIDPYGDMHVLAVAADGTEVLNDDFSINSPRLRDVQTVLREIAARVSRAR